MPTVYHPRALETVRGHPPSRVTVLGDDYEVAGDSVDLPTSRHVDELAGAYDVDTATLYADGSDGAVSGSGSDTSNESDGEETDSDESDGDTCETVKTDGEVCGRERPCPYHD